MLIRTQCVLNQNPPTQSPRSAAVGDCAKQLTVTKCIITIAAPKFISPFLMQNPQVSIRDSFKNIEGLVKHEGNFALRILLKSEKDLPGSFAVSEYEKHRLNLPPSAAQKRKRSVVRYLYFKRIRDVSPGI